MALEQHGTPQKFQVEQTVLSHHGLAVILEVHHSELQDRFYYTISPFDSNEVLQVAQGTLVAVYWSESLQKYVTIPE